MIGYIAVWLSGVESVPEMCMARLIRIKSIRRLIPILRETILPEISIIMFQANQVIRSSTSQDSLWRHYWDRRSEASSRRWIPLVQYIHDPLLGRSWPPHWSWLQLQSSFFNNHSAIFLHFWQHVFAFLADIEKAFLHVYLGETDMDSTCLL